MNDSVNSPLRVADLRLVLDLVAHPAYPHLKALLRTEDRRVRGEPDGADWGLKAAYQTGKLDGYENMEYALDNMPEKVKGFINQLEKAAAEAVKQETK